MTKEEALKELKQIKEFVDTFYSKMEKDDFNPTNHDRHVLDEFIKAGRTLESHLKGK